MLSKFCFGSQISHFHSELLIYQLHTGVSIRSIHATPDARGVQPVLQATLQALAVLHSLPAAAAGRSGLLDMTLHEERIAALRIVALYMLLFCHGDIVSQVEGLAGWERASASTSCNA
jgi:hypothetical protein